jgi:predicted RecB family nuclease
LQVAHYNRLLDEVGHAASAPFGGVIGSEAPYGCLWVDLSQGDPSIVSEYATIVAATEEAIEAGSRHPDSPLYPPWWRTECRRCDWSWLCSSELEATDDVTLLPRVNIADRDALSGDGITTVRAIAGLDFDDDRLSDGSIVLQARARTAGHLLRREEGNAPLPIPRAPREVDFDIETYDGAIYLAGFLVTVDDVSTFEPVYDWSGTTAAEAKVVSEMFDKLATYSDNDTMVLHWTDYERRTLRLAGERHGLSIPGFDTVDDWFDAHALDLCAWSRKELISPNGYGLKVVAPLCGFDWRDDDPGGRQSEVWFEHVLAGDEEMKERLLAYNEDDVIAQLEIRRWLRAQDNGNGPGSAIPSVHDWPL